MYFVLRISCKKQSKAKQNKTKQNKTKQNKTKQNKTKQNKIQNKAKQNKKTNSPVPTADKQGRLRERGFGWCNFVSFHYPLLERKCPKLAPFKCIL